MPTERREVGIWLSLYLSEKTPAALAEPEPEPKRRRVT